MTPKQIKDLTIALDNLVCDLASLSIKAAQMLSAVRVVEQALLDKKSKNKK